MHVSETRLELIEIKIEVSKIDWKFEKCLK